MLIVVAIIAILIAVSIPMVTNALERARVAADAANERAFKAELLICYLANDDGTGAPLTTCDGSYAVYAYDTAKGKLVTTAPTTGYGKCTQKHGSAEAHNVGGAGWVLYGSVSPDGQVYMTWAPAGLDLADKISTYPNIHGTDLD